MNLHHPPPPTPPRLHTHPICLLEPLLLSNDQFHFRPDGFKQVLGGLRRLPS